MKRYKTEHDFEMLLIKWKSVFASGDPFQASSQGENTSNRNLNIIIRLAVTKTEIFENDVTVDEYFSREIFH